MPNFILAGHRVAWVQTFDEVRAALLREHFDVAVLGTHFAESNALDVLRHIRERSPGCRIACVRGVPFPHGLGRGTMEAFEHACTVLGAAIVIDLLQYPDDEGGDAAIRRAIGVGINGDAGGAGSRPSAA